MKDALVAAVVHDLKNALAALAESSADIAERSIGSELEMSAPARLRSSVAPQR